MCEGGACRRDPRGHGRRSLPPPDTSENRILSLLLSHPAPSGPGKGVRLWRLFRGPPREMAHCPPPTLCARGNVASPATASPACLRSRTRDSCIRGDCDGVIVCGPPRACAWLLEKSSLSHTRGGGVAVRLSRFTWIEKYVKKACPEVQYTCEIWTDF